MDDTAVLRRAMIDRQLRTFDVTRLDLLAAVERVPREPFVPEDQRDLAYADREVPLEGPSGRVLLQPMVLLKLIQALEVAPGEQVIEVAGGTGYGAAVLAALGARATLQEDDPALAAEARRILARLDLPSITVTQGPIDTPCHAGPWDVVLISGAVERRPEAWLAVLADGGRLGVFETVGAVRRAVIYRRAGTALGRRAIFEAAAAVIRGFEAERGFVF